MKNKVSVRPKDPDEPASIFLPDGSRFHTSPDRSNSIHEDENKQLIVVTGAFPARSKEAAVHVETIRDPKNSDRLKFLVWENGSANVVPQIERERKIFVLPDPTASSFPLLTLPTGITPCGTPAELLGEIRSTISKFVKLRQDQLLVVATFVLASWFPDCFEAAPNLWIVGPLGTAKTKLLKLLSCLCRRSLIAGDMRSGSLYKLTDSWDPTLIIDELEPGISGESAVLLRMLRTGSVPGVSTYRNGRRFSTYCLKVMASRQPPGDVALSSRVLIVSMLPTEEDTLPLNEAAMHEIENEFQAKLLTYRLKNYFAVKNFRTPPNSLLGLSPRMQQIARALRAALLDDPEITSELLTILRGYDDETRIERSLEPEWLFAEDLFRLCHRGTTYGRLVPDFTVGWIAAHVNASVKMQSEGLRFTAKEAGLVLKSLGLRTVRLGSWGRGFMLTSGFQRKIHEIARQLGIDRRCIVQVPDGEEGYGGAPCPLCEEFGVTGGLRFVDLNRNRVAKSCPSQRRRLFDRPDDKENVASVRKQDDKVQ
jgi:hypothetical protein